MPRNSSNVCVRRDTTACGLVLALLVAAPSPARAAQSMTPAPRVLWAEGDRAVLSAPDSLVRVRDAVEFSLKGKPIASGWVESVTRGLAIVSLESGTLGGARRLEEITVTVGPRPHVAPPAMLRLGLPAPRRPNGLFSCQRITLRLPDGVTCRVDTLGPRALRLVRDSNATSVPWPDTVAVRFFADVADQEIALERGELDAAVFWPGELSTQARARDYELGTRSEYLAARVVAAGAGGDATVPGDAGGLSPVEHAALALLNSRLFRGDLDRPSSGDPGSDVVAGSGPPTTRFEVDPRCPERDAMERLLNQGRAPGAARVVRLTIKDARDEGYGRSEANEARLAVRCAVLSTPEARFAVQALGAERIARLMECGPEHPER
jgi:hypothetical protein